LGLGRAFPVAGIFSAPLAHPLDVFGSPEHVAVLGFAQPAALALGFAGFAALGLCTELLMPPVAAAGNEQLFAMQALAAVGFGHASS